MSDEDKTPEVEQETKNNEETEDETTEEETVEESKESDEVEKLRQENAKLQRLLKKNSNSTPKPESNNSELDELRRELQVTQLRQEGYSEEVVSNIMELGGKEALKNPLVKAAVDNLVQQEKTEAAGNVDGASQSSTKSSYSIDELKNMSSEEMAKHLPKVN